MERFRLVKSQCHENYYQPILNQTLPLSPLNNDEAMTRQYPNSCWGDRAPKQGIHILPPLRKSKGNRL